jgi:hypothetical protein
MTMPAASVPTTFDPANANFEALPPVAAISPQSQRITNVVVFAMVIVLLGGIAGIIAILLNNVPGASGLVVGVIFVMFLFMFGTVGLVNYRQRSQRTPDTPATDDDLIQFAADNALLFRPRSPAPAYPGCIFSTNTVFPYVYNHFTTTTGRFVDFGNLLANSNTSGMPDNDTNSSISLGLSINVLAPDGSWGFMAVQMSQHLPNMLLVSKQRGGDGSTLPITPDSNQILHLEGDFDQYFTLYCPQQFEQDALYVFTPDLMALLIDEAAPLDVEIVDKWMFFYARKPFNSVDPAVYRRLFTILSTIGTKIVAQTSQYSDPALGPVAPAIPTPGWHWSPTLVPDKSIPPGDRLRQKSQLPVVITILAIFLIGMISLIVYAATHGATVLN